ncbi:YqjK-like family protein [Ferrovum sp.]|uniref:YqjK-like family protein n=1 Tax=Ferrovum sp. TaxID=2609467 RepID=UPI002614D438|nr:YqjK-like family protein [Ferrovum sp.]
MSDKLAELAKRRERLVAQATVQREILAQSIKPWLVPLTLVDQGLAVLNFVKKHPVLMIGGVLLSVYRSNPLGKYLKQGLVTWLAICKLR